MQYSPEETIRPIMSEGLDALEDALREQTVLESRAFLCDTHHALHFTFSDCEGVMPFTECALGAQEGGVREVAALTRVGRPTCFVVTEVDRDARRAVLSRRIAQERCKTQYLDALRPGDILPCRVTHLESFGAFCDVGCGVSALLPIDCMSISRIAAPSDRLFEGQRLHCIVKARDEKERIVLTLKELLGTWSENAARFHAGETVLGVVRSVESYGVFIELAPNLTGLAEAAPQFKRGQAVSVYIKSITPEKMKVKLAVLHRVEAGEILFSVAPTQTHGHIERWTYSTPECAKIIETVFDENAVSRYHSDTT